MNEPREVSLFERMGGQGAVEALVDRFYDTMETRPDAKSLRALHGADLAGIRQVLKLYLCEWLGGPKGYTSTRGHPRLRARHLAFPIGIAERDTWLSCMQDALSQVVADEDTRHAILQAMAPLADFMRNRPGEAPPGQG